MHILRNIRNYVPDLRFPKPVEYLIFSDICEVRKKSRVEGDLPLIELDCISQNTGELIRIYNSNDSLSEKNYFERGDVLFGKLRPYLNKHFLPNFSGMCSSEIWPLIPKKVSSEFLYCFIQSKYFLLEANISSGTKMPRADWKYLATINVPIFTQENMNRISKIIIKIEQRISTQKKIIEDYEFLKKAICNNIFKAKLGTKYPLSLILFERNTYSEKNNKYTHVTLSKDGIIPKTDRYNRDFLVRDENKEYKITKMNDLCYNPANLKFGVICKNNYGDAIFSPIYVTFEINKKHNADYVSMLLTNSTFIRNIRKYEQGTVYERTSVNPSDFLKGEIYLPNIEKQFDIIKKIKLISNKITIEKEILSLYEKQKQYLLNHMFI